jgi:hypothetical protein
MSVRSAVRLWLTPVTTITFSVVMVTGILMLLHVHSSSISFLHELVSIAFALTGMAHVWLNWPGFVRILQQRTGVVALVSTSVVCAVLALVGVLHEPKDAGSGGRQGSGRDTGRAAFRGSH